MCDCNACRKSRQMPTPRQLIDAADVLSSVSPEALDSVLRDPRHAAIIKARGPHAPDLTERERVRDPMNDPHGDFRREQNYGRKTEASGAGAEELSRRSSTPVSGQSDETSALGEALERGVSELEKGVRLLRDALARARNQAVYPDSNGKNGGAEKQPREEGEEEEEAEERERAKSAFDIHAAFSRVPDGLDTLQADAKAIFSLLMAPGVAMQKADVGFAKARGALNMLDPESAMQCANVLLHMQAAKQGNFPMSKAVGELANQRGEVLSALARALRA